VGTDFSYVDVVDRQVADGPGVGGIGADLRALLARWWREAPDYQRFIYTVCFGIVLAGMFHGLVWAVRGGSWTETVSWRKPTIFLISTGLTVSMCTWVTNYLRITRRQGWQIGLAALIPGFTVDTLVALQQWRGTRSHFNFFESSFDAAVAGTIAFIISLLVPTMVVVAVMTFRRLRPGVPPTLALAIRAGVILINVSFLMGLVTILNGVSNVLLFTMHVPSVVGTAGTTKVAHGLPLHGIQIFVVVVGMLSYTAWSERRRLAVLSLAVAGYIGLVAVFVVQSALGREPFDFIPATMLAMAVCVGLLLAGIGSAATAAVRAIRRGVRSEIIPSYPWVPAVDLGSSAPGGTRGFLGFFDGPFLMTAGGLFLFVAGIVLSLTLIGLRLPSTLVFTRTALLDAPPERVWALVTNYAAEPGWRRELTSVRRVGERSGRPLWQEQYWNHQRVDLDTVEQVERPGHGRLVRQMTFHFPTLASGVRVVEVWAAGGGTRVTMTEKRVIRLPPFRTLARLFIAPQLSAVTAEQYLAALGVGLGKAPRFE